MAMTNNVHICVLTVHKYGNCNLLYPIEAMVCAYMEARENKKKQQH